MSNILNEITTEADKRKRLGFINYWIATVFLFIAVIFSLLPAISLALPTPFNLPSDWVPLISAVPAAVIFFLTVFKFEKKYNYHWEYARHIRVLLRELRDQGESEEKISKKYNKLTLKMGKKYPGKTTVIGFEKSINN